MKSRKLLVGAWLLGLSIGCPKNEAPGVSNDQVARTMQLRVPSPAQSDLPVLGATEWINSEPRTAASLRGKVVLVQFWTYSCINWRRTLPYLRAWSERYGRHGLVLIGVHSPEFEFEKDAANVRQAVRELRIGFPVAVDSRRRIWNAFDNGFWPALYLFGAQGELLHRRFGEGEYERAETLIQQALIDAGEPGVGRELSPVFARGPEVSADWPNLHSPETYLGYERTENFASFTLEPNHLRPYTAPARLALNEWALSGDWTVQGDSAVSHQPLGRILFRFHARDLHLVMGPASSGTSVRFRVRIDGRPPAAAHGVDVGERGDGALTGPRMYHLVRQPPPITAHDFELEFLDPGAEVFSFSFG